MPAVNRFGEGSVPLIAVFDDSMQADRALDELHHLGIKRAQIQRAQKSEGKNLLHLLSYCNKNPEDFEQDLENTGISQEEVRYYERVYTEGKILLIVHAGDHQKEISNIFIGNGGYNYTQHPSEQSPGSATLGMRAENSAQTGSAIASDGIQAIQADSAVTEAEIEHAQRILTEKNQDELHP